MNELLKKIYDRVLVCEETTVKTNRQIDEEINCLIATYADKISNDDAEELKDILSAIALTSQQAGFESGVRFILELIFNILAS